MIILDRTMGLSRWFTVDTKIHNNIKNITIKKSTKQQIAAKKLYIYINLILENGGKQPFLL